MNLSPHGKLFLPILALFLYATTVIADDKYDIIIIKSQQELDVVRGEKIIRQYHIAYGKGGKGPKRVQGDSKTPVGIYRIINFRDNSNFHYFMHLDYPNLLDAWYGYKNNIITAAEFKEIAKAYNDRQAPPQYTRLGGNIGIHGLGKVYKERLKKHVDFNWTNGCIALTNEQINDLKKYVSIGTKVVIRE